MKRAPKGKAAEPGASEAAPDENDEGDAGEDGADGDAQAD